MAIRLYIYRCKTKCIFYKQYFVCSSLLDKCKEDWCRPKHPTSFPCSVSKEASHKLLKVAAAKKYFPSVFIVGATCFDEYFSFHVITAKQYFLHIFIVTKRLGATTMLLRSFKQVFWKKSVFYIHYLHNNITMMLIVKLQDKASI